jgi:hypothetical protein
VKFSEIVEKFRFGTEIFVFEPALLFQAIVLQSRVHSLAAGPKEEALDAVELTLCQISVANWQKFWPQNKKVAALKSQRPEK